MKEVIHGIILAVLPLEQGGDISLPYSYLREGRKDDPAPHIENGCVRINSENLDGLDPEDLEGRPITITVEI